MSGNEKPTSNDQRSNAKNPSSKDHWQNQGNRGKQMDPKQNQQGGRTDKK
jgi:hypothetical protein